MMKNHHAQPGEQLPGVTHIPGDGFLAPPTATAAYPWWLEITGELAKDYIAHQFGRVHHTQRRATIGPWKSRRHAERVIADIFRRSHPANSGTIHVRNFHLDTKE
jgi:hypothetical protein